jgi:F-type H+-transporting ATPase subunit epsilon
VTLQVELVVPEGELWAGQAEMVIAKTLDGEIGVLTGHSPVIGILATGSMVRIYAEGAGGESPAGEGSVVTAAVSGGFFSVADNQVSVLARQAQLGIAVDAAAVRAALDEALTAQEAVGGEEEPADVRYYRAQLRAAGEHADGA